MNYQRLYDALIKKYQNTLIEGYSEKHHIIPRCMGGSNNKNNLVRLTAKAHFVAHHLLCKIYPDNRKLKNAFGKMIQSRPYQERSWSPKMYETLKKALSEAKKGIPVCDNRGRKRPDVTASNIARRGEKRSQEYLDRMRAYYAQKIWPEYQIENRRRAGKIGGSSPKSEAALLRIKEAANKRCKRIVICNQCGHKSHHSPNFFRHHMKNCRFV